MNIRRVGLLVTMLSWIVAMPFASVLAKALEDAPLSQSPLAGNNQGHKELKLAWSLQDDRIVAVQVNTGRWRSVGPVILGLRMKLVNTKGEEREEQIGPCQGEWQKAVALNKDQRLIGISGRHGAVLDSIRFHFSDGQTSPRFGGSGGDNEYRLVLKGKAGKYQGQVRGLFGYALDDAVTGLGLLLTGQDGKPAALSKEDDNPAFTLTLRGEIDAEFAPIVGQLSALYYQCYPKLVERYENPKKPATRHVTLTFKRNVNYPAFCTGSEITINVDWLKRNPNDIGLLTHELTHVVQAYPMSNPGWLVEGIADYARKEFGPKEQPGWQLPKKLSEKQSYRNSYRVTARFLEWLDQKQPGTVVKLHQRMQSREFELGDFKTFTGKSVDELWQECVSELNKD